MYSEQGFEWLHFVNTKRNQCNQLCWLGISFSENIFEKRGENTMEYSRLPPLLQKGI
jgi:hypothetical protein